MTQVGRYNRYPIAHRAPIVIRIALSGAWCDGFNLAGWLG